MKKLYGTLFCAFCFLASPAQTAITLNSTDYQPSNYVNLLDTLGDLSGTSYYPILSPVTNAFWDFTGVTYDPASPDFAYYQAFTSATLPAASFASIAGDYLIQFYLYYAYALNTSSLSVIGKLMPYQAMVLPSSSTDSLVAPTQTDVYTNGGYTVLKFPTTYKTGWHSRFLDTTRYLITLSQAGYNQTPALRKTYVTSDDSVIGWGNAKIKTINNVISSNIPALLVRERYVETDSFFINGAPLSNSILAGLNITQGQQNFIFSDILYRKSDVTPLVLYQYGDSTYSSTNVSYAAIEQARIPPTAITTLTHENAIAVYPNPTFTRSFTVTVPGNLNSNWSYTMFNSLGQLQTTGRLSNNGLVTLPETLPTGNYILQLSDTKQMFVKQVIVR